MKILLCTNVFETIENGPVKFAHLLLEINNLYPEHTVQILTEDSFRTVSHVHKVPMKRGWQKSPFSQLIRMWVYHRHAMRLRKAYPFDVLVYNNALVGLVSAVFFPRTVGMINDDNNAGASLATFTPSRAWLKRWLFGLPERAMAHKAYRIIVNSDYLRETLLKTYTLSGTKIVRLYKGIDTREQKGSFKEIDPGLPIQMLFVKNDYRRGGLEILAAALDRLSFRFRLTLIGPNETDRSSIKTMFAGIRNTEIVNLGKQNQEKVLEHMREADIFCVPSYREALGVANLEAMACGIPVVTTNVGGIPEVLDGGRCGWMVPPGDAEALARALQECITDPERRRQKIKSAENRVKYFSKETMFINFLTLLSD